MMETAIDSEVPYFFSSSWLPLWLFSFARCVENKQKIKSFTLLYCHILTLAPLNLTDHCNYSRHLAPSWLNCRWHLHTTTPSTPAFSVGKCKWDFSIHSLSSAATTRQQLSDHVWLHVKCWSTFTPLNCGTWYWLPAEIPETFFSKTPAHRYR